MNTKYSFGLLVQLVQCKSKPIMIIANLNNSLINYRCRNSYHSLGKLDWILLLVSDFEN